MTVSAAMLDDARLAVAAVPPEAAADLSAISDVETLIAYTAATARAADLDPADMVEMLVRLTDTSPAEVRRIAAVLGRLGDREVAERLRQIAGRRVKALSPLPSAHKL